MSIPSFNSPLRRGLMLGLSPWVLVGGAIILSLIIAALAVGNIQKGRQQMIQNLHDRADSLIWTIEAGTRAWMVFRGGSRQLQTLVEETSKQGGIDYIAVTDSNGNILAHTNPYLVGSSLHPSEEMNSLGITERSNWRLDRNGVGKIFEVYKIFSPAREHMHNKKHQGRERAHEPALHEERPANDSPMAFDAYKDVFIFVGLDITPFEGARNAERRNILLTAIFLALLGFGGFVSMFWAHNYRLSRRLLKDTQLFAASVVSSLPVGLITSDARGKVALANSTAADLTGITRDKLTGMDLNKIGGIDWPAIFKKLKTEKTILDQEINLISGKNRTTPISLSASTVVNDDGLFLGHLFILRDLREVKRLQEQLQRSERLSALGNLAAGVAHEIRNPLSSIKGYATILGNRQKEAQDKEAAALMVQEADRLDRVVSELLEFARPSRMNLLPQDINQVIKRALRLSTADMQAKDINIIFQPDDSLPLINIDAERLTQALLNLFLNAVQAMDRGGTIRISTSIDDADCLNLRISDDGCGISDEMLSTIFNPYVTSKPSGTGLGLAVVHRIVEGHGGKIKVESKKNCGTTFTIKLSIGNLMDGNRKEH